MKQITLSHILIWLAVILTAAAIGPALRAQSFEPLSPYGNVTPSVETFTMTRYGSLVPSLYTGAMTYSLPIYTYQDPDFTIPVTLEYHYDGYKPSQHSGSVGLGWSLGCGGVVTREIRGLPDEGSLSGSRLVGWKETRDSAIFYTADHVMSLAQAGLSKGPLRYPTEHEMDLLLDSYDPLHDIPVFGKGNLERWYDAAPDLYHFDFCGYRGDFMILKDGSVRVYNSNVPFGELSVKVFSINETLTPAIEITTAQGYTYYFGDECFETAHSRPVGEENLRFTFGMGLSGAIELPAEGITSTTVTAFHLCLITAPNGRSVQFNYSPLRQWELFVNSDWIDKGNFRSLHKEEVVSNNCYSPMESIVVSGGARIDFSYERKQFDEDSIAFFISQEVRNSQVMQDLIGIGYWPDLKSPSRRLSAVTVRNADGEIVDSYAFTHSYAPLGTKKMFLSSVTGLRTGTHGFEYNLSGFTLPPQDHLGYDHWGYWNGQTDTDVHLCLAFDNFGKPELDLYGQMATTQKDPNAAYSLCGSLKEITYPTGGTSSIEYEANTVSSRIQDNRSLGACTPWTVGGLRVKRIIDRESGSRADTTSFLYTEPTLGYTSGMLMQMPRHSVRAEIFLSGEFSEDEGITVVPYSKSASSVCYSNKGVFNGARDHFIAYRCVTQVHPDGSRTLHVFSTPEDLPGYGFPISKNSLLYPLNISVTSQSPHYIGLLPLEDRKNLRGLPADRMVYDAEGRIKSVDTYTYDSDVVTVDSLMFNEVAAFYIGPSSVVGAGPAATVHTDYFYDDGGNGTGSLSRTESTTYNAYGQKKAERTVAAGDTLEVRYRYLQETGATSPSGYKRLPCDAVRLRHAGGRTYLLAAEHYDYGHYKNPRPTRITSRIIPEGTDVTGLSDGAVFTAAQAYPAEESNFSYDTRHRLTQVSFPGGAYITYTWDGNNIASKTENGAAKVTLFDWKDLVGLTGVTSPGGQTETYRYDARNRPYKTLDGDGRTLSVSHYRLKNE